MLKRLTPSCKEEIRHLSVHPNGRLLALLTQTGVAVLDLRTGEEMAFLRGGFGAARFDLTGALWTAGEAGIVRWPVRSASEEPSRFRVGPPEWVADVMNDGRDGFALSADGHVVGVPLYSEGAILIHRGASRRTIRVGPQFDVRMIAISPDGRWLATSSHWLDDTGIKSKLWEASTGRLVSNIPSGEDHWIAEVFQGYGYSLVAVALEGRRLASFGSSAALAAGTLRG